MQRTVFEKDVLDKPLIDVGIDEFAGTYDIVEGQVAFDDNQCPDLLFAHTHAGHDDGHDVVLVCFFIVFLVAPDEFEETFHLPVCTDREKEVADFFLEQDNQCQCTDADQLVENGTQKFHFQYLRDKQPEYDENQHAEEYVQ